MTAGRSPHSDVRFCALAFNVKGGNAISKRASRRFRASTRMHGKAWEHHWPRKESERIQMALSSEIKVCPYGRILLCAAKSFGEKPLQLLPHDGVSAVYCAFQHKIIVALLLNRNKRDGRLALDIFLGPADCDRASCGSNSLRVSNDPADHHATSVVRRERGEDSRPNRARGVNVFNN